MATAAVLSYPTHGHIAPALGVAGELARRGERVVFYATGRSRRKIEAIGAEFRSYGYDHDEFSPDPPTDGLFSDMSRLAALSQRLLPNLLEQVREDKPDYLLADTKSLWGRLTGQVLGIPAITLSVVFAIQPRLIRASELVNLLYAGAPEKNLLAGLRAFSQYLNTSRQTDCQYGTASPAIIQFLGNPHPLNIVFTSREFQLRGAEFGEEYRFVGPSIAPERRATPGNYPFWAEGPLPLIYISLGTTFHRAPEFYRACFQAFADAPRRIVLSSGAGGFPDMGAPPANFVVREFVPQLEILERASLFITHGGMNSANEGLYYGVPLIVVPQRGDQHLVAARVAELGAGLALPPQEVTPQILRQAAEQVLANQSFRANAQKLGQSLRSAGGYKRAAAEILAAVGTTGKGPPRIAEQPFYAVTE